MLENLIDIKIDVMSRRVSNNHFYRYEKIKREELLGKVFTVCKVYNQRSKNIFLH